MREDGIVSASLQEEERMAQWVSDNVEKLTRMYLEKEARGEKEDR